MSFVSIRSTVAPAESIENPRKVWERRSQYKSAAASGVRLDRRRAHGSHFNAVDKRLYEWFLLLSWRGRKRIPFTISLLQEKAGQIGKELGLDGFGASQGFVQAWARRHNLASVVLNGSGGSVNIGETEKRMSEIRAQLQDFQADKIFNMDETGPFRQCLPNRSLVPADQRRVARGTKAMKVKEPAGAKVADHDHVLGAQSDKPGAATPRPRPSQHARSYLVGRLVFHALTPGACGGCN